LLTSPGITSPSATCSAYHFSCFIAVAARRCSSPCSSV
jgi:hypothetical protein